MNKLLAALVCVPALSFSALASAQVALYPSGPDEDAAFIRFVNATTAPLDVIGQAGQPPLRSLLRGLMRQQVVPLAL